jgi:hypothetical protein
LSLLLELITAERTDMMLNGADGDDGAVDDRGVGGATAPLQEARGESPEALLWLPADIPVQLLPAVWNVDEAEHDRRIGRPLSCDGGAAAEALSRREGGR